MIRFQVRVCDFAKNRIFRNFDLIDDGDAFIILFKDVDTVIDDREDFHRNNIIQASF